MEDLEKMKKMKAIKAEGAKEKPPPPRREYEHRGMGNYNDPTGCIWAVFFLMLFLAVGLVCAIGGNPT
jgi:hypothetical protein